MLHAPGDFFRNDDRADLSAAISQLEQATLETTNRTQERIQTRCQVLIRAGNASERTRPPITSSSLDVSATGCRLVATSPVGVGDIYWLEFARDAFDLPPVFARCLRCRLVREDAYEAGFTFFLPVALPGQNDDDDSLVALL